MITPDYDRYHSALAALHEAQFISDLDYGFAKFVCAKNPGENSGLLALSCVLLSYQCQRGDVCIDLQQFADQALFGEYKNMQPPLRAPALKEWRSELERHDWVGGADDEQPLILYKTRLYLQKYWSQEQILLRHVSSRLDIRQSLDKKQIRKGLQSLFADAAPAVDDQRQAVAVAALHHFCIISGGPRYR